MSASCGGTEAVYPGRLPRLKISSTFRAVLRPFLPSRPGACAITHLLDVSRPACRREPGEGERRVLPECVLRGSLLSECFDR